MAAIDTLHEIAAEVSVLQSLASNLDSDSLFEDFGWGLVCCLFMSVMICRNWKRR